MGWEDCVREGGVDGREGGGREGDGWIQCQDKTEERDNKLKAANKASVDQPWTTRKAKLSATKYYLFLVTHCFRVGCIIFYRLI